MMDSVPHEFTTLISVEAAAELCGRPDVVFVDCRFSLAEPEAGRLQWRSGHIPGAHYAHLDADLSGEVVPGKTGRHPLPDLERFVGFLERACVTNETQVIAYDASGGPFAARLWWLLKYVGHERVAVLDGGWPAWRVAGLPADNDRPVACSGVFRALPQPDLLADADAVSSVVQSGACLIDARAAERFAGHDEPIDPVAGHIPGAQSFPFKGNLDEDGRFKSPVELRRRFASLESAGSVISYCGSGVTATHNVLAMNVAGLPMPRVYIGSWSEWITDGSREIATGIE